MKIAIHQNNGSFSDHWTEYCDEKNIPWKPVCCYDNNIIEQLVDCDALMWHFHHANPKDMLFAKQLLYSVETMGLIERFMECRSQYPIQWTCRKYRAESKHMTKSSFADWLVMDIPDIPEDDRVNTSLTLSEPLAIQSLNKSRPEFIPFMRDAFASVLGSEKAADRELTARYITIASGKLMVFSDLIDEVNKLLLENEKLMLTSPAEAVDHTQQEIITLTKEQVTALVEGIEAGTKSDRLLQKSSAIFSKVVDKVNRKIKTLSA